MDWPHDPDGEAGSEGRRKYGHAILAKKVDESEDFPLAIADYLDDFGDHPVRIDYETVISVREALEHVSDDAVFEDFPAFHSAAGAALRDGGHWPYRLDHA